MLNADDSCTPHSLQRLKEVVRANRPLVFWIGAGASRWAGLPSWRESARRMRKIFAKSIPGFPDASAEAHIASEDYPRLFELCRDQDRKLYHRTLLEQFNSPQPGPVYTQLIEALKRVAPVHIVTTNVDLCLEQSLGPIDVVERTDLERCVDSIQAGTSFIAKLHGSISSIESVVFTSSDYERIVQLKSYLAAIQQLFSSTSVLFLGYGLQDDYILRLIGETAAEHPIFGSGPHFRITSEPRAPQDGIYSIGYRATHHQDHRAALTVLSFIEQKRMTIEVLQTGVNRNMEDRHESGFYISYFTPSGLYSTGHQVNLNRNHGTESIRGTLGFGFVEGELPSSQTVAFHDLAVGLICFDRVFLPLEVIGVFHDRATPEVFWELMKSDCIGFVDVVHHPFYVAEPEGLLGHLGLANVLDPELKQPQSSMDIVRKLLKPASGQERAGEALIDRLEKTIMRFADSECFNLAGMVRDALLLPRVSDLLGYSEFIPSNRIPRWLTFPTLRFAHLVQTALICDQLRIQSSRVPFGGVSLVSAAFSLNLAEQTVFDYASFVLTGTFASNLSTYFERNPQSLLTLINFRESAEGEALRREVHDQLKTNEGAEFSAAVEGGLKRIVSFRILEAARDRFSMLMMASNRTPAVGAIWGHTTHDDASLSRWRNRSRELLLNEARSRGVRTDAPCLCGSSDKLKDCCLRALR